MTPRQIKRWRTGFGWTQEFTAFLIDMPYETFRSLETGRRTVPQDFESTLNRAHETKVSQKQFNRFKRRQQRRRMAHLTAEAQ